MNRARCRPSGRSVRVFARTLPRVGAGGVSRGTGCFVNRRDSCSNGLTDPGAIGFDRARRRVCGVSRMSVGLVNHPAITLHGNYSYAMAA